MKNEDIFIEINTICKSLITKYEYPYEVLPNIKEYILDLGKTLDENYILKEDNIWIHKTADISPLSTIIGPTIIDEGATLRPGAFIRGGVVVGKKAVVGNSCEVKNSILFDEVQVPHFNYVGDSILGYKSHLGAGSITSNVKGDKKNIIIKYKDKEYVTNMKKIGAILGDRVEIGCNSVLNPGTIIKNNTQVYPLVSVRGVIEDNMIVKDMHNIVRKEKEND